MNTPDTEIQRFKIIVIQSLKQGDLKTGERLYDDVLKWKNIFKPNVPTEYYTVDTKEEFIAQLDSIKDALIEGDILTLQLETHGSKNGIALANGDSISWNEFQDLMRVINEKIGGLLVVCLAMCFGGATISTIQPEKRAPYRAIVAPYKEVPAGAVEDGFKAFYDVYDNMMDLPKAFTEIQKSAVDDTGRPYFDVLTSENIFDQTFDPDRDPVNTRRMAELQCMRLTGSCCKESVDAFELQIRTMLQAVIMAFRDHYLFKDIYKP